ncbi:unnamed protein product [Linum trigynum]|uniref:Uncharacterized protein n=1 Tax=Linum trigynum TaxID=586398 RepID=A0AAV2E8M8_9ROSI
MVHLHLFHLVCDDHLGRCGDDDGLSSSMACVRDNPCMGSDDGSQREHDGIRIATAVIEGRRWNGLSCGEWRRT